MAAECLEIIKGSLFMDQLLRDRPDLHEWILKHHLEERFFLYNEYNEARYCMEMHVEGDEFVVHLIKLTDDVEFFGEVLPQIKYVIPSTNMPVKIITDEKYDTLRRTLRWKRYKEEVLTDEYNRKTYIYTK